MLLRTLPSLLLAATAAHALKDAAPFFLLSSEPLRNSPLHSQQLAMAQDIETAVLAAPTDCSTPSLYFLVAQPGITAADLQHAHSMPNMRRRIAEAGAVVEVPEVMGAVDVAELAWRTAERCGAEVIEVEDIYAAPVKNVAAKGESAVLRITFEAAAKGGEHGKTLAQNGPFPPSTFLGYHYVLTNYGPDKYLDTYISAVNPSNLPYTLLFTSTPPTSPSEHTNPHYEMDDSYPSALHTDLKRDVAHPNARRAASNSSGDDLNMQAGLPLFETYQFLSPGTYNPATPEAPGTTADIPQPTALFMGLSVSVLLFLILYVGVSAIAGLEVSYMAFSKEMGPKAQQQQQ
ncbi:hypothetical protein LTR08_007513 [Meristemomyces frigidus]|nr:hypothetical protein LTR08_007513 [Meristemomyces frigidus]